jgi:hypothetical protein
MAWFTFVTESADKVGEAERILGGLPPGLCEPGS